MASEKPKCPECPRGLPAYLATFSDLMSLLLTFFVLLLSMATFEPSKFAMTTQSLQGAFGVLESFPTVAVMPIVKIPKKTGDESKRKQAFEDAKKIKETVKSKSLDQSVKVKITKKGLAITLNDVGFASGSADLGDKGKEVLEAIGSIYDQHSNVKVRVEGHTDDVPISGGKFASNWELSSARALNVVKQLHSTSTLPPDQMSGVGYGEFKPLVANVDAASRAKNRRIEIFVNYQDEE